MKLTDSRRLTGPNLLLDGPGAVAEVAPEDADPNALVESWRTQAQRILELVGWTDAELASRVHRGGLTLAFSAPVDALYAATEVNEWAIAAAEIALAGGEPPDPAGAATRLRAEIGAETNPSLQTLRVAAAARNLSCLSDDDEVSLGLGFGSSTWPALELPTPDDVDWPKLHDIPVALVTGTNGKSTTVRMLASIADAAGRVAGLCSTDWIRVGDELVLKGDYSGPGGARRVLRHPEVEIAILETARGGMLRRGLAVERADVALVTNVAEDHLGESGVYDLDELARAKLIVAKAAGRLVLNADDPLLARHGPKLGSPITWFTLDSDHRLVEEHRARGGLACRLMGRQIVADRGLETLPVLSVDSIPTTLGGAARHNVANAMAAVGVALALDLPMAAIREGLTRFESSPGDNPGRLNVFNLGGVTAIVDFAHNPHGVEALLEMAAALPANRRLITTGQAGDRDDASIRLLAARIAEARPDRVLVKRLDEYRRGRPEGEVQAMIVEGLLEGGLPAERIGQPDSEMAAIRQALAWASEGDLLLLITHSTRSGVLSYLESLRSRDWRPGDTVLGA